MTSNAAVGVSSASMAFAASLLLAACGGGSNGGNSQPAPGTLDPGFGDAGTVILAQGAIATGLALQADGKIIVAAVEWIVRYERGGTPDPTFGSGGFARASPPGNDAFGVRHVSSQADGKILAAGSYVPTGGGGAYHCALARYSIDGSIDPTFGNGGIVVWEPEGNVSDCTDIALQRDGRILLAIHIGNSALPAGSIARFHADGSLDASFGANGVAAGGGNIAIQPDGKILAASVLRGHGLNQCTVTRVDAGGVADASFGEGGMVAWTGPFDDQAPLACALALQPDGMFIVTNAGSVARFLANGAPDSRFGGGIVTGIPGVAVAVQSNGKIVIAGSDVTTSAGSASFALWRLDANGARDSGFGNSGMVVTPLLGQGGAVAVAIQPDGRILAAGWSFHQPLQPEVGVVVRYVGD